MPQPSDGINSANRPAPTAGPHHALMSRRRRWIASALIAIIGVGHLVDISFNASIARFNRRRAAGLESNRAADFPWYVRVGSEHWPFSPYPMYSYLTGSTYQVIRMVGVRADDGSEFELHGSMLPMGETAMRYTLNKLSRRPDDARLRKVLGDCLRRYESMRTTAGRSSPKVAAMRVYRLEWTLSSRADPGRAADRRDLLAEFPQSED